MLHDSMPMSTSHTRNLRIKDLQVVCVKCCFLMLGHNQTIFIGQGIHARGHGVLIGILVHDNYTTWSY